MTISSLGLYNSLIRQPVLLHMSAKNLPQPDPGRHLSSLSPGTSTLKSSNPPSEDLSGSSAVTLAHKKLKEIFQDRGLGEVSKVEQSLGYSRDTISQWRRRGKLEFRALVDILCELRYAPISFFAELFRPARPANRPSEPAELTALAKACAEADELRYTDPIAALGLLSNVHDLSDLSPALYAGSAGSIFRTLQMPREAQHFLTTALMLADDAYSRASIHRRLAPYELYCNHDCDKALQHVTESISLFESIGAHHDAKRSTINILLALHHKGDPATAEQMLCLAEDLINWSACPARTKMAALQVAGMVHNSQGRAQTAYRQFAQASGLATDPLTRGQNYWSLAAISPPRKALEYFDKALDCFGATYGYQTIACTIHKVSFLNLDPTHELPKLRSLTFDCAFFTDFAQELASAAVLKRLIYPVAQTKLDRAWSTLRTDQARQAAAKLLARL